MRLKFCWGCKSITLICFFVPGILDIVAEFIADIIDTIYGILTGKSSIQKLLEVIFNDVINIFNCYSPEKISENIPIVGDFLASFFYNLARDFAQIPILDLVSLVLAGPDDTGNEDFCSHNSRDW